MISINDAEQALNYLKSTDEEAARAKSYLNALEDQKKTILAVQFHECTGSAAERTQKALASDEYSEHIEKIKDAMYDFELLRNRRKSAEVQFEMWRSINSNQRKGNI